MGVMEDKEVDRIWRSLEYAYIHFGAEFQDERTFGSFRIPSRMRASWEFDRDRPFLPTSSKSMIEMAATVQEPAILI